MISRKLKRIRPVNVTGRRSPSYITDEHFSFQGDPPAAGVTR
jgi:hypothetical protein